MWKKKHCEPENHRSAVQSELGGKGVEKKIWASKSRGPREGETNSSRNRVSEPTQEKKLEGISNWDYSEVEEHVVMQQRSSKGHSHAITTGAAKWEKMSPSKGKASP